MTPLVAFILGVIISGFVCSLMFGAFHLNAEDGAYHRGVIDGIRKARKIFNEVNEEVKNDD